LSEQFISAINFSQHNVERAEAAKKNVFFVPLRLGFAPLREQFISAINFS
jgi:hypothetical protein